MQVVIENGLKTITHDSGHVDTYNEADMQQQRDGIQSQVVFWNDLLIEADVELAQIQNP